MRKVLVIASICLLPASHGHAEGEEARIAEAAQKCWAVVDIDQIKDFAVTVDAKIEADGRSFFRATDHTPKTQAGQTLSDSAIRALRRCAPYDVPPGLYRFTMKFADPFK